MSTQSNLKPFDAVNRFFRPESVAIVGASQKGNFVTDILKALKRYGFQGKLVAVNPRYEQVECVPCYPSLAAIPHPVGLAVVGVPSDTISQVLQDAEAANVGAIQVISSGFADQGAEGIAKQQQLVKWSERTGTPVAGPNCLGLMNLANRLVAMAMTSKLPVLKAGSISAVLQSGAMVTSLVMPLLARGIGVGRLVTTGNEACADVADFISYFAEDEETRVIVCYCEQIKRPLEFVQACERAADNGKPIVMIKVGRSEGARQAALAHTGSLVGSDVAIDAVLKKLGVVRVDTIEDLIETAAALSSSKRPRGPRVAFASFSGGAVGMLSDLADPCGIEFTPLPAAAKAQLAAALPSFGSVSNPLDVTAQGAYDTRILDECLGVLSTCGSYDMVVWGGDYPSSIDMRSALGEALRRAAQAAPEVLFPVLSLADGHFFTERNPDDPMVEPRSDFDGMPFLQGIGSGLKALSSLIGYSDFLRARRSGKRLSAHWRRRSDHYVDALRILHEADGNVLTEREGKRLLALYGIPVTREALAGTAADAMHIAQELGFPVVMKVESAEILHKTDVGGVELNITSPEQAAAAYERIMAAVRSRRPDAHIAGVVVQEMAKPGIEMMLGATFDAQFGPVIALGLGGIWVEALKDVRAMLPPFDAADVQAEIGKLSAVSVLRGARGGAKADLETFADCVVKFATLCTDLVEEIGEIDINPVILASNGAGLVAVDCLITRKRPGGKEKHASDTANAESM